MNTINIYLDHSLSKNLEEQISEEIDELFLKDCSFNGAEFCIDRDDYTCVNCDDGRLGAFLYQFIQRIIESAVEV